MLWRAKIALNNKWSLEEYIYDKYYLVRFLTPNMYSEAQLLALKSLGARLACCPHEPLRALP